MSKNPPSVNQMLYARLRSNARTRSTCGNYAKYEARKSEWIATNPEANSAEFEAAMRSIAKLCGV